MTVSTEPSPVSRFRSVSLRTRLVLGVSLVLALVLGVEEVLEIRLFEKAADRDLRATGLVTAEAVVDDLELRPGPWLEAEITESLHEFARSVPSIRAISVVRLDAGLPVVIASTVTTESDAALALAREALTGGAAQWRDEETVTRIALRTAPTSGGPAAVVVTVSLASMAQLRTRGRLVSFWLVPLAIVVLTVMLDQVLRRLVHRPVGQLRDTMARAGAGELGARAPVDRLDEMGELAVGLNQMLDRLADFNLALEDRIRSVTAELDRSHAERIDSYQRMLTLRDALAQAERLAVVGQAAASVAHQVGTPLNLISGHVQVLLGSAALPPDVERRLRVVQDQIGRVADAVRGLVEHSRRPGAPSAVDLRQLLVSIVDLVRPKLLACDVALEEQIGLGLPAVRADRNELEMALLNLVTNAVDAMPHGGQLRIVAEVGQDGTTLTVEDSGVGIAPELLPRIFEPWITTKAPGRGTGLGLSITRDVITRLGGTIAARSGAGGGTIFVVTFPPDSTGTAAHAYAADR